MVGGAGDGGGGDKGGKGGGRGMWGEARSALKGFKGFLPQRSPRSSPAQNHPCKLAFLLLYVSNLAMHVALRFRIDPSLQARRGVIGVMVLGSWGESLKG